MMATFTPPRPGLIDSPIGTRFEIDRLLVRLRGLERRLDAASRHLAWPGVRPALGAAYLLRAEDAYDETLGRLHAAYREAQALCLIN